VTGFAPLPERSETVPARIIDAAEATLIVTPAPTVAAPDVLLKRSVPELWLMVTPAAKFEAPVSLSVPRAVPLLAMLIATLPLMFAGPTLSS